MANIRILLTVTDGCDNCDHKKADFERAISSLNSKGIYSLSCGIGTTDVDHEGLAEVARRTGGRHIAIRNSLGIAAAIADLTTFITTRIAQVSQTRLSSNSLRHQSVGVMQQGLIRVAIDILILIDCSWSMLGMRGENDWSGDREKLPRTKEASVNVLRTLNPNYDRAAVARFWEKYQLIAGLTSDFKRCAKAINGIDGNNGTGLYRAICFATEDILNTRK